MPISFIKADTLSIIIILIIVVVVFDNRNRYKTNTEFGWIIKL